MPVRTSCQRLRAGSSQPLAIPLCWLTVTVGIARLDLAAPVVAYVRLHKSFGVAVDDVLIFPDGRRFVVQQLMPESETVLLACGEVVSIIPDDFSTGAVETWWTARIGGWAAVAGESRVMVTAGGATPGHGAWLAQSTKGDFDIVSRLWPSKAATHVALLGVRFSQYSAVYVGLRGDGAYSAVRVDQSAVGTVGVTAMPGEARFVRMKRVGANLLCFYSLLPDGPVSEDDWKLIRPTHATVQSTAACEVGLCVYGSGVDPVRFDYLRNYDANPRN